MSSPYNIEQYKDGYSFVTKDGVFYYTFFTDVESGYFPKLNELKVKILTFGFTPLNKKEFDLLPSDARIGTTCKKSPV